jgi:NAD(P)-dependent dehydrogenase (short-subunit alcohol dehydrogenase family)
VSQKEFWALILGASSSFGKATAIELARRGYNIFGVHLDRKATMPQVEELIRTLKETGRKVHYFNINAADPEKRRETIEKMKEIMGESGEIRVLLHSLAFGTLKRFIAEDEKEMLNQKQLEMTLDVMANTLVYWVQDVVKKGLMGRGGRIFAMTSSGSHRVWWSYGAVSAAKAALESHVRQLALELAKKGITVNAIRAGVTDTPALRKIPGHEEMLKWAQEKNPMGRITRPEDVARAIAALSSEDTYWITGNVIGVDGGEDIVG